MTFDAKIIRTEREGKLTNGLRVDTGSSSGRAIVCSKHENYVHGVVPLPLLPLLPKCLNAYNRHFGNRQGEGPGDEIAPSIIREVTDQAESRPHRLLRDGSPSGEKTHGKKLAQPGRISPIEVDIFST